MNRSGATRVAAKLDEAFRATGQNRAQEEVWNGKKGKRGKQQPRGCWKKRKRGRKYCSLVSRARFRISNASDT